MRSSIILSAAFAASAIASPLVWQKRDLEVDTVYDVVYVTQVVTQTVGAAPAATSTEEVASAAATTTSVSQVAHYGHRKHSSSSSTPAPATTVEVSTSAYVAPSSSVAPAPATSSAAASSPAASSAAAKTSSAATSKATTYQQRVVAHHNIHRSNHSASPLVWDDDLASSAAGIAASCVYAHNVDYNGGGYGQNIAAGVEASNISAVISDLFYNGEVNWFNGLYGQENPDMTNFEKWGHFSQIVWKGTTKVGCATQDCSASGLQNVGSNVAPYFTVCNYGAPGNYAGEYGDNIGSPTGLKTEDWSYDM